jgi:DNA replication and repair protein RecF
LLQLQNISLVQFKNSLNSSFVFEERIVGFCGKNGVGKTNLLDAIYYLCFTKSYFSKTDIQNVRFASKGFRIEGNFVRNDKSEKVICVLRENGKKECSVNDEAYLKFSAHIGRLPCVMVAPDDVEIITSGSEERRKFLDYTLSQLDPAYLQSLMDYNRILQQRNYLLRSFADSPRRDESLLDVLTGQLLDPGNKVHESRKELLEFFLPIVQEIYETIAGSGERLEISYQSQLLSNSFENLMRKSRDKDILLQRTQVGIHRDDLQFTLNGENFKSIASQGQRKSLLFALKLAEFQILLRHNGFAPILLLDDVFEKLDDFRMRNLLHRVCVENKGQIFITDTHCERLKETLELLQVKHQIIELADQ